MKWLLLVFFLPAVLHAQKGNASVKFHAYYAVHYAGNIPVDEQGNPTRSGIDTVLTLVAEVAIADSNEIRIDQVCAFAKCYNAKAGKPTERKMRIAYDPNNQKEITLLPAKGNILLPFQLNFLNQDSPSMKTSFNHLIITGTYKSKRQQWSIDKITALPSVYYP